MASAKTINSIKDFTNRLNKMDSTNIKLLGGADVIDNEIIYTFKVMIKDKIVNSYTATTTEQVKTITNRLLKQYDKKYLDYDYSNLDAKEMQYIWHTTNLVNCNVLMFLEHYFYDLGGCIDAD